MKVAHLSDVHWRGLSRHEEYREVFTRYFEKLKELSPDLIFIGGDIVHSKTQGISPEVIDNLVWWFKELAKIAPTHVTLGNHDGILFNDDRQDAISPIIEALNHKNIFLYKKSGTYKTGIPGFNWCVFSCFDEKGWANVKPVQGEINIATFHGAVWGAKTDIDWELTGEINVSFFDNYQFAFLGDIHKMQFLNEQKTIAFSGSTIQQNFGEQLDKGFLFWDIRSKTDFDVEFHKIPGRNPFVTIDWLGSVKNTVAANKDIPQNARVRIRSNEPIPPVEWKHLRSELEFERNVIEVVAKDDKIIDTQKISTETSSLCKEDLRDAETIVKLIREHLKDIEVSDVEFDQISQLARNYVGTLSKADDFSRGGKWSLKKIEFDNTFAYGMDNVINFENLPGITGIFGRNAKGKSSIVGTIMYALYNATDRGSIKNRYIINTRKNHCIAKATVTSGEEILRFERQTVKHQEKDGSEGALTYLNLFRVDETGEVIEDQSREQRRVSDTVIRSKIGNADDFLLTTLASQGEMNVFIKQKNTARKAILTRFLGLDIFDKLTDMAKEESKNIQAQVKNIPDRDWDTLIDKNINEKTKITEFLSLAENEIDNLRKKEHKIQIELNDLGSTNVVTRHDVINKEKTIQMSEVAINNIVIAKQTEEIARDKLLKILEEIEDEKKKTPIDELKKMLLSKAEIEKSLIKIRHTHEIERNTLCMQEKSVEKLKEVPCNDKFPLCKFIKESHENKQKKIEQKLKVDAFQIQLTALEENFATFKNENIETRINAYDINERKIATMLLDITKKDANVKHCEIEINALENRLKIEKNEHEDLKSRVVDTDIDETIIAKKEELSILKGKLSIIDTQRLTASNKLGRTDSTIESLKQEKSKYQELKQKWRVYDLFQQAVSKRGIPLQIIMSQLPAINIEIAKILQGVTSFGIELEADLNSNEMDVFIDYGESRRIIEVASGMEKMLASLAIRVALINISSLPKSDMLIIDEGFGTLDDLNVEACNKMLESLKKWFKNILIITHIDGVKDAVDNIIDITWEDNNAKVVYK